MFTDVLGVAPVEPDFADYPRIDRTWGCNVEHGTFLPHPHSASHVLNYVKLFKVFAIQPMGTGIQFAQDLKLAHYMKIPPRTTFWGTSISLASSSTSDLT